MDRATITAKKRLLFILTVCTICCIGLVARVYHIIVYESPKLQEMAYEQQTRDRLISPKRGNILDRKGVGIAVTESVTAVSVIHNQVKDEEGVARFLADTLSLNYDEVLEKVKKRVALVRIKTKVDKETADKIRAADMDGIVVDEDVKRIYPYTSLASHVLGFVGKDNQGIIGLESKYEEYLKGEAGKILTLTDARGLQVADAEERIEPINGYNLVTTLDVTIQQYAEQTLQKAVEAKQAKNGIIIVLNPQNGEVYAMANYPSFDLNKPFEINSEELMAIWDGLTSEEQNTYLNKMWRNTAINDTYEPGSTFKTITSSAGLEEGVITPESTFVCNGYYTAGDRMIKCWRYPRVHGAETFVQGVQNSCNPVFMITAERLGAEKFYEYMIKFGFNEKTGIDLPGEAVGIMHKLENIGPVELATMSFGQSFQITPLQLLRAVSSIVNGGKLITPHVGKAITDDKGNIIEEFKYEQGRQVISAETSEKMKTILESVVSQGTGNKSYIPGYRIGGKTATSEKLPRRSGKYIASFLSFAPAENPQVMAIVLIDEPKGVYYGGTVAGPVMKELLSNVLPYIGIEPIYNDDELKMDDVKEITVPDVVGLKVYEAEKAIRDASLIPDVRILDDSFTENDLSPEEPENTVYNQFPPAGELVNKDSKIIIYKK